MVTVFTLGPIVNRDVLYCCNCKPVYGTHNRCRARRREALYKIYGCKKIALQHNLSVAAGGGAASRLRHKLLRFAIPKSTRIFANRYRIRLYVVNEPSRNCEELRVTVNPFNTRL